jgi:hypothetical protein
VRSARGRGPPEAVSPPFLRYHPAMLRISWPLALLLALCVAIIARRPRLLVPLLVVFGVWFLVQSARRR